MPALVPPGIYHQKDKDDEAEEQQYNRTGLVFPKQLQPPPQFVQIHDGLTYTGQLKNPTGGLR